tara:strand:- start:70416 stop:71252 length:837 start_codon:yes stop_codon:yes gene_type:complete
MKLKVTKKAGGELFIRAVGRTYKVGATIKMTSEQYLDSTTQAAIRNGFLELLEGQTEKKPDGVFYVNVHRNELSFQSLEITVPKGARFFVPTEHVEDMEIVIAHGNGHIELAEEIDAKIAEAEKAREQSKADAEEPKKTTKRVTKKKSTKKASKKTTNKEASAKKTKTIKRLSEEAPQSIDPNEGQSETHLPEAKKVEAPEGMYAHDPTGEGMTVRTSEKPKSSPKTEMKKSQEGFDDLFVDDSQENLEPVTFVDQEQDRERYAQLRGEEMPNNDEVS